MSDLNKTFFFVNFVKKFRSWFPILYYLLIQFDRGGVICDPADEI